MKYLFPTLLKVLKIEVSRITLIFIYLIYKGHAEISKNHMIIVH